MNSIVSSIFHFSHFPSLLVAIYALGIWRKSPKELRYFFGFVFISVFVEVVAYGCAYFGVNNMPLLHLYVAGGFLFVSQFYKEIFIGFIDGKIINIITGLFLMFTIINSLFIQSIYSFNSYAITLESIIIIVFSITTSMLILNETAGRKRIPFHGSLSWINSGLFIYYVSSLIIFYFGDFITRYSRSELTNFTWILNALFSTIMYCCFFVGLWRLPRKSVF